MNAVSLIPFSCTIMAGGKSSRMGGDKALLHLEGETLLARAARLASSVAKDVYIVGRTRPEGWPADLQVRFVPDDGASYAGPMIGICTALRLVRDSILVVACDMPLLTTDVLQSLYQADRQAPAKRLATIAATPDATGQSRAEPLLAVYHLVILPELEKMLASGSRSLQQLLQVAGVNTWPVPEPIRMNLLNVNDPASLEEARRSIGSKDNR